jgi:hypothetical protein
MNRRPTRRPATTRIQTLANDEFVVFCVESERFDILETEGITKADAEEIRKELALRKADAGQRD